MDWFAWLKPTPAAAATVPFPGGKPAIAAPSATGAWLAIALTMVAGFEGLYTHAYKDPVGVVTICYGVTNADRKVKMGDTATVAECKGMLAADLPKYKAMMEKCIHVAMPPHRTAAMVSFTYNVGQGNLCKSSVARYMNAGEVTKACDALLAWNKAGGRVLKGLDNRRRAERVECKRSD